MNSVNLTGRLVRDPELRFTQSGVPVCSFTLAVDRGYKDANGERQADFIDIAVWRQQGENCASYLSKGSLAGVTGKLQTRTYETQDGSKRKAVAVVAEYVDFLTPKSATAQTVDPAGQGTEGPESDDDDLPF